MVIHINQESCAGCGVCVDACPAQAIYLVDYQAVIDDALCTQCEVCLDACPNGAITACPVPVLTTLGTPLSVPKNISVTVQRPAGQPEIPVLAHKMASLTGTALVYLGKEILPFVLGRLVESMEWRSASSPAKNSVMPVRSAICTNRVRAIRPRQSQRRRRSRSGKK